MCCCLRNCSWLLDSLPSQSSISGDRIPAPHPADKKTKKKTKAGFCFLRPPRPGSDLCDAHSPSHTLQMLSVKKGSWPQCVPLSRQGLQKRGVFFEFFFSSPPQPWRCSTWAAAIPLDLSLMGETETSADSDQKRPGDYLFPMSSVQRRVVHALSLSSAPLSPALALLRRHSRRCHLSRLCNTATFCSGALGCQQAHGQSASSLRYKKRKEKKERKWEEWDW